MSLCPAIGGVVCIRVQYVIQTCVLGILMLGGIQINLTGSTHPGCLLNTVPNVLKHGGILICSTGKTVAGLCLNIAANICVYGGIQINSIRMTTGN